MNRRLVSRPPVMLVVVWSLMLAALPAGAQPEQATVELSLAVDADSGSGNDLCVMGVTWDGTNMVTDTEVTISPQPANEPAAEATFTVEWQTGDEYYLYVRDCKNDGFTYYFPQWSGGSPKLRVDLADPLALVPGQVTDVSMTLRLVFQDMFSSEFMSDIIWMQHTGVTTGCGVGAYCVTDPITRGQMAAFLNRALELPSGAGVVEFTDDDTSIFENDIEALGAAGITKGCNPPTNDRFCPSGTVERGQFAAFLTRAMDYPNPGTIDFVDDDDSIFENDIEALAAAGVTKGCNPPTNDRFCPNDLLNRGQMAAFLHRALGDILPAPPVILPPGVAAGIPSAEAYRTH